MTVTSPGVLDLAHSNTPGTVQTIGGLSGNGTVNIGNAGSAVTLVVGNGDRTGSFSGSIANGSGTVSLTKTGTGTQTLGGASTYTGATAVNGGTLLVNGSITSNTTVTSPAILGGSGTITGNVSGTGTVTPGTSPGILTVTGNYSASTNFEVNRTRTPRPAPTSIR